MPRNFHFFACSILTMSICFPAVAEKLTHDLQLEREYYNSLSDDACAGDITAYRKLKTDALDLESPVAMNDLAWLYFTEECSFREQGIAFAVTLQHESAGAGYPIAINNYAHRLMKGEDVLQDSGLAIGYFERAIERGYGTAAVDLAEYLLRGEYVAQDYGRAVALLRTAVQEGADAGDVSELSDALDAVSASVVGLYPLNQATEWDYEVGQAGWGLVYEGREVARVFVGVDEETGQLEYGFTRESTDPIIHFMGVSVNRSGKSQELHFGRCGANNCLKRHEEPGQPGTDFIGIPIVPNAKNATLEALKAGKDVKFRFQTRDSLAQNKFMNLTLGLKGSRDAIEYVERDAAYYLEANTQVSTSAEGISAGATTTIGETAKVVDPAASSAGGAFSGTPITCYHSRDTSNSSSFNRDSNRISERFKQINEAVIADPIGDVVLQYLWGAFPYERVSNIVTEHYAFVEQRDYYSGVTECSYDNQEHYTPEAAFAERIESANSRGNSVYHRTVPNWKQRVLRPEE